MDIHNKIEAILNDKIVTSYSIGGGCIADSRLLKTASGKNYFLKSGCTDGLLLKEANGLHELAKTQAIRVPNVIAVETDFLLLEYIESGLKKCDFFEDFGRKFAQLHRYRADTFGFYEDNFIGATPQPNIPSKNEAINWTTFYFNKRLLFQYKLAEKNGYASPKLHKGFQLLENKIEQILAGSEEPPSLLHGDLWGGNYICDENGEAVLIDPAVYYGHREADLAMTKLFGGFTTEFYNAYNNAFLLPDGYGYRENIYLLYHVMNHLNFFGTGYLRQAEQFLWHYL